MNTPSGALNTVLDQFVLHYNARGYEWADRDRAIRIEPKNRTERIVKKDIQSFTSSDDDIIFYRHEPQSVLCAEAVIENNKITGFEITKIA